LRFNREESSRLRSSRVYGVNLQRFRPVGDSTFSDQQRK